MGAADVMYERFEKNLQAVNGNSWLAAVPEAADIIVNAFKENGISDTCLCETPLLKEMGLGERMDHKPSELSGGEQQRVAIARALVNDPAILFADEPSGNLDSKTKSEIHQLFFDLRERYGQTVVIVTHDPELAAMCDRSLFMRDGLFE